MKKAIEKAIEEWLKEHNYLFSRNEVKELVKMIHAGVVKSFTKEHIKYDYSERGMPTWMDNWLDKEGK